MSDYRRNAEAYLEAADQWADRRGYEQFQQWLATGRTLKQAADEIKAEVLQLDLALVHVQYLTLAEREENMTARMKVADHNARRALDRWAVNQGWSDFDLYLASGNSVLDAKRDLIRKRNDIDLALGALGYSDNTHVPPVGPEALAAHEAEVTGEPLVQGGEE